VAAGRIDDPVEERVLFRTGAIDGRRWKDGLAGDDRIRLQCLQ
jgi:hypothetical protein